MATYAFPDIPHYSVRWSKVSNTEVFVADSGVTRTTDKDGERWRIQLQFRNLIQAEHKELIAFLMRLNGQQHRFTWYDRGNPNQGSFAGAPVVDVGGQTGITLDIRNATALATNFALAGDFFSVNGELKMCVGDPIDIDASGNATLEFTPRLRASPSDGTAIVDDNPAATWILEDREQGWLRKMPNFADISFSAIEDIA